MRGENALEPFHQLRLSGRECSLTALCGSGLQNLPLGDNVVPAEEEQRAYRGVRLRRRAKLQEIAQGIGVLGGKHEGELVAKSYVPDSQLLGQSREVRIAR